VTELPDSLERIGADLQTAVARLVARRRRRRRSVRVAGTIAVAALALSAAAIASGIGPELQLDPTKWSVLGGGTVEGGQGQYVHAQRKADGSPSTFMVEHDDGLEPYEAFVLHERLRAAADETSPAPVHLEPGSLCTRTELVRVEQIALDTLRATFAPGTPADSTRPAVMAALVGAFGESPCRGLEYGGEAARLVYAGTEPRSHLMAGVR
jgi:hypothetical protein